MPVTFSIFTPVYNDERWLPAAIDSVLAQTYPHFEFVIGDNASDQDIRALVAHYADPRIRYHRFDEHRNFADNHNRTIQLCGNDWLQVLSADDRLHPECLERFAQTIVAAQASGREPALVIAACRPVDEDGRPATFAFSGSWRIKRIPSGSYSPAAWLRHVADPGQNPWNVGAVALSRRVWSVMAGYLRVERGLGTDVDMVARAAAYGPVEYLADALLDYTVRTGAVNRELARADRSARMTAVGGALLSALEVHEALRPVAREERRHVERQVADTFVGRALQHRYVPGGRGWPGAVIDLVRATRWDRGWILKPRHAARALLALTAPRPLIVAAKDRFARSGRLL